MYLSLSLSLYLSSLLSFCRPEYVSSSLWSHISKVSRIAPKCNCVYHCHCHWQQQADLRIVLISQHLCLIFSLAKYIACLHLKSVMQLFMSKFLTSIKGSDFCKDEAWSSNIVHFSSRPLPISPIDHYCVHLKKFSLHRLKQISTCSHNWLIIYITFQCFWQDIVLIHWNPIKQ